MHNYCHFLSSTVNKTPQQTNTTKKVETACATNTNLSQQPGRISIQVWYVIHTKRQFADHYLGHCCMLHY